MPPDAPSLERPVTIIEQIGERCLQVVRDHAGDTEADLRLIADFMWALGVRMEVTFAPRDPPVPPMGFIVQAAS